MFYVNIAGEKREMSRHRGRENDTNAKKKRKIPGDGVGTGFRGSKGQEENSDEDQRGGQGGSQGRKEKRGRSGSKRQGEIEERREGPRRAEEGIDHSLSL